MTRLDRARLDNAIFPHQARVATRFADLDQYQHVNNVAVAGVFEEARYPFFQRVELSSEPRCQLVIAACTIEYATDMLYPDPVDIVTGVLEIGRTSVQLAQVARQNGRVTAYAVMVQVSRNEQGPVPLPDAWRARFESLKITHTR
jgi:acyl-CoA thioester hydrolase